MKSSSVLVAMLVLLFSEHSEAWPTKYYSDTEVVQRASLIVLARIKEGSIQRISEHGGYEHHAVLIISRIIKGEYKDKELTFTLAYGLLPVSASHRGRLNGGPVPSEEVGQGTLIYEDNPSEGYFRPSGDVHQEQIWLLHPLGPPLERSNPQVSPAGSIGISNPEDLQPLEKEQMLVKCLLAP